MQNEVDVEIGIIHLGEPDCLWTNQSGGYACKHPVEAGELEDRSKKTGARLAAAALEEYFCGPKWNGWCCDGIDEETALTVEAIIRPLVPGFTVNRERLSDSMEAWVYFISNNGPGVLVWENSD